MDVVKQLVEARADVDACDKVKSKVIKSTSVTKFLASLVLE